MRALSTMGSSASSNQELDGTRLNGDRVRFAQELGATCDSQTTCATRCGKFVQRSASLTGAFTSYLPFALPSITQI